MTTAFAALLAHYGVLPARNGWADAPCPNCGHRVVPGRAHFQINERIGHCFSCGYTVGLARLAERVGAGAVATVAPPRRQTPRARPWQAEPSLYVRRYCEAPDRLELWRAYRPLALETIAAWELGVGALPASKCGHRRLTLPIRTGGKVVALAGRAISCDCPKWLLAGGSEFALFNVDGVTTGSTVLVTENRIDAVLAMQEWPDVVAVAKGSANVWKDEWTRAFVAAQPELTVFWPDNDAAGMEGAARGANELLAAGLRARVRQWSAMAPAKADLGAFLMALREVACVL